MDHQRSSTRIAKMKGTSTSQSNIINNDTTISTITWGVSKLPRISTKQQACCKATLASMTQQLAQLLEECQNLPCISTKQPERNNHDIIPQPSFDWPSNLIKKIKVVISTPCATPTPPEFSLDFTAEGAAHNLEVLRQYDFNLSTAVNQNRTHRLAMEKSSSPHQWSSKFLDFIQCGIEWKLSSRRAANGRESKSTKANINKIWRMHSPLATTKVLHKSESSSKS
jgi:hypothetical protein